MSLNLIIRLGRKMIELLMRNLNLTKKDVLSYKLEHIE